MFENLGALRQAIETRTIFFKMQTGTISIRTVRN
ncbi:hypothetical protein W911_11890 [Hyphomicrobium nitrativorans NL23]|uniref:Uncharacterized protein n=1 Tax=Hyphomicrobium nitrativorans NL23 TaxID=1029756 RepID=V5SJG7_9HYPH|nr:hypothetical protein W911_11890 [Hyphomicrobium nitrativorans NL23]